MDFSYCLIDFCPHQHVLGSGNQIWEAGRGWDPLAPETLLWRQSDGLGHCNIIWEVEPDGHGGPFNPSECDLRPLCITTQT